MFNVPLHRQSQKTQPYTKGIAKLYKKQALACFSLEDASLQFKSTP